MNKQSKNQITKSIMIFELPFGINLPDGLYDVKMNSYVATIFLKKIMKEEPVGLSPEIKIAEGMTILGDRWGRLFHAGVDVIFYHEKPPENIITVEFELRNKSIDIINRLLKVFAFVTNEPIQTLAKVDIFSESYKHFDSQGNEIPGSLVIASGGATMRMGNEADVGSEKLSKIRDMLTQNIEISLVNELILSAKNHLFFDNLRIAVIEAETAFEVFIHNLISKNYQQQKMDKTEIENILDSHLKNLLEIHLKKSMQCDFINTNEYKLWQKAYDIRNDIVHEGKLITQREAIDVVKIFVNTMNFLYSYKK